MKVRMTLAALGAVALLAVSNVRAAVETALIVPTSPSVAVTGAATTTVANDRMQATLRVEAENTTAAAAANEVNARMAKALAKAKATPGVETRSAGYSTFQQWEKGRPSKWKVVQSIALMSNDFTSLAGLVSRLQDEDQLLISGMSFSVSTETRRKAEDSLTREAIRAWQQRATTAAEALGYANWRTGRLSVSTGDIGPPVRPDVMMMRAQAAPAGAPVAVEGGTTEITVTVTGDAMLDSLRAR
ncbi:MAG TPA: SIMPL domain-containing protein [Casimicrobiaceae bacterium]|nr:SIMPL domain-containing protein [Casimicrobiaceae bacterium]